MFANRAVRRVAIARFISATGGEAAFFVGIWGRAAYDFGAAPAELALLMAVVGLTGLAGSAAAGVLVDRYGPRRVMIAAEAVFVPIGVLPMFVSTMPALIVTVAAGALAMHVVLTAISSLPPFLTDGEQQLARANTAIEIGSTFALVSGPAAGAVVAATLGLRWIFPFDSLTSLVAVALVAPVPVRSIVRDDTAQAGALAELREGVRFAYSAPMVRYCLIAGLTIWMSFAAFGSLEPLFYREVLGTGPEAIGWVNSLFGLGLAAGALAATRLAGVLMSRRGLTLLGLGSGVAAVVYSATADLRVVVIGAVLWGVVLGALFPALRTLIQLHTPDGLVGRVMGVLQVHHNVGVLLPLVAVPSMAAVWGVQPVLVGSGVGLALLCALAIPLAASLDRYASVPADG